ncbi:hypothetical protein [Nonomuraea typhae]|uniref:hypothetical protein n=1 Tax=Nonomuraea typhae TaxID=2603600 RepID=UPI001CA47BC3|nr:hypothetical protein [Nonomuraea typhae]
MTISPPSVLLGAQAPRVSTVPPRFSSAGQEAVELAASAGLHLDPWQARALDLALGERADGTWAAFEVGLIVGRQNGKGSVLEARELAGLFLFGERLLLHSAHEFKTSGEAFLRVKALIDNTDDLRRRVARMRTSHGEEGIELIGGQRLRFVARSTGSGRGFSGDTVILDEAYALTAPMMAALLPTLSAKPNPQVWYASSAPLRTSEVLKKIVARGREGSPRMAYLEWSAPQSAALDDREAWAQANPALGIRISSEFVEAERVALEEEEFARERLGIGADDQSGMVIDLGAWAALADPASQMADPVAFCMDMTPERSVGSIAAAGRRADGRLHVEVVEHRPGTAWMVARLQELRERWKPCAVVIDPAGPAGSLIAEVEASGVEVVKPSAREHAQACGQLYDAVMPSQGEPTLRHLGQLPLNTALAGARKRDLGDAWAWARKGVSVDISPLVAVTLAAWGHATRAHLEGRSTPWVAFG